MTSMMIYSMVFNQKEGMLEWIRQCITVSKQSWSVSSAYLQNLELNRTRRLT